MAKEFWSNFEEIDLQVHTIFLNIILISLFYCCKKVFTCIHGWLGKVWRNIVTRERRFL